MIKVLGGPWERILVAQGPAPMIVDLYLKVCELEGNPFGGEQDRRPQGVARPQSLRV
ncbi:unnamed protein product [Amoebophrya sp. A25]|nr:unnamed protein product [Amoebophrya sp. A25]|eukprot:GSA25T00026438001.1